MELHCLQAVGYSKSGSFIYVFADRIRPCRADVKCGPHLVSSLPEESFEVGSLLNEDRGCLSCHAASNSICRDEGPEMSWLESAVGLNKTIMVTTTSQCKNHFILLDQVRLFVPTACAPGDISKLSCCASKDVLPMAFLQNNCGEPRSARAPVMNHSSDARHPSLSVNITPERSHPRFEHMKLSINFTFHPLPTPSISNIQNGHRRWAFCAGTTLYSF